MAETADTSGSADPPEAAGTADASGTAVGPFASRVESRALTIAVVGLGYVGLPLAVAYAATGFEVCAFDLDEERISVLASGSSYIEDVPEDAVAAAVESGRLMPTSEPGSLADADVKVICVPTPFDDAKTPNLSYVVAASETVAESLAPGNLIILQSTSYPGTTNEVVRPILESSGLKAGVDFGLAFSPERVDPGNKTWTVRNTPKVVGAVTADAAEMAKVVLEAVMDEPGGVTVLSCPEAAEMTKLLENTFRAVNIALVNELALLSERMDVDIWEVIRGASTKPFGFMAFTPGPGVGGHCIAVDPHYLAWRARTYDFQAKFIELAADANERMPRHVMHRAARLLNEVGKPLRGSKILALGVAFKSGVSDTRNSAALKVLGILRGQGAEIAYSDPHVAEVEIAGEAVGSIALSSGVVRDADLVLVLVAHPETDWDLVASSARLVFDAVNALDGRSCAGRLERL